MLCQGHGKDDGQAKRDERKGEMDYGASNYTCKITGCSGALAVSVFGGIWNTQSGIGLV